MAHMTPKKKLGLGLLGICAIALIIGLSVGLTKDKGSSSSSAGLRGSTTPTDSTPATGTTTGSTETTDGTISTGGSGTAHGDPNDVLGATASPTIITGPPASTDAPGTPLVIPTCAGYYAQCGGIEYTGATCCQTGQNCFVQMLDGQVNPYYSQCLPAQTCDDGNTVNTDACTNAHFVAICGDGIVHAGVEACDDGNMNDDDDCTNSCTARTCSNAYEQCGGTGNVNPTCCKAGSTCKQQVNNGVVNPFYSQCIPDACDDQNDVDTDYCTNQKTVHACGDGVVYSGTVRAEACDGGVGCTSTCTLATTA